MTGLFFALVGLVYERAHTRHDRRAWAASRTRMPASRRSSPSPASRRSACPGTAGFVAEFLVFLGAGRAQHCVVGASPASSARSSPPSTCCARCKTIFWGPGPTGEFHDLHRRAAHRVGRAVDARHRAGRLRLLTRAAPRLHRRHQRRAASTAFAAGAGRCCHELAATLFTARPRWWRSACGVLLVDSFSPGVGPNAGHAAWLVPPLLVGCWSASFRLDRRGRRALRRLPVGAPGRSSSSALFLVAGALGVLARDPRGSSAPRRTGRPSTTCCCSSAWRA